MLVEVRLLNAHDHLRTVPRLRLLCLGVQQDVSSSAVPRLNQGLGSYPWASSILTRRRPYENYLTYKSYRLRTLNVYCLTCIMLSCYQHTNSIRWRLSQQRARIPWFTSCISDEGWASSVLVFHGLHRVFQSFASYTWVFFIVWSSSVLLAFVYFCKT